MFASAEGRDNANQSVIERQAHAGRNRAFEQGPIASLFASGHVSLLWLTTGYHLRATFRNWPMLDMPMRDSDCPLSTCPPTNSILDVSAILIFSPSSIACAPRRFISSTPCDAVSVQERAFQRSPPCAWQSWRHAREPAPHLPHQLSLKAPAA